jgi:hypothetical protein
MPVVLWKRSPVSLQFRRMWPNYEMAAMDLLEAREVQQMTGMIGVLEAWWGHSVQDVGFPFVPLHLKQQQTH